MITIKATIFFEKKFWVGTFERMDKEGYSVARYIFGGEPTDTNERSAQERAIRSKAREEKAKTPRPLEDIT
ncbi:MAG: hypothetical protein S4CHLAM20_00480 [Chlamydiia bacterium]|nr:hypothetical protein [Chlamydiia bacterium]